MNASSIQSKQVSRTNRWFSLGQLACSAVAVLSLALALPSSWPSALVGASASSKAVAAVRAIPPTASKPQIAPIQDIQLGERLAGRNPLREQVELEEPDQESWRAISLHMQKANGLRLWIELLRPIEWLADHNADVGSTIFLDLEEMGAVGDAEITAIKPCPPIEPGDGAVVTGKFKHESDGQNVLLLTIEGQAEPTGVTSNHPYWSVDRQDFVPAGQLREGELLNTKSGPCRVVSVTPNPNYTGLLYNLETTEHVYEVGVLGQLVHNGCAPIHGNPQYTSNRHANAMKRQAKQMANSGDYVDVFMHSKWSTILKGKKAAVSPDRLPDVAGVRRDGRVDIVEFSSSVSDSPKKIYERNKVILEQLPEEMRGSILVFDHLGKLVFSFPE